MKLITVKGVDIFQDDDKRVHYIADLSVDVDGAKNSYRLDNRQPPALDDIHASAGYPNGSWYNVLVRNPQHPATPFVDAEGFCVSMTSYKRMEFEETDRRRYVDPIAVPYSVPPGIVRKKCRGVLLGCAARITDTTTDRKIDCVMADFSGNSIGEAGVAAAKFFNSQLSAHNGDDRRIYLYEFWPDTPAVINGETFKLIPAKSSLADH